METRPKSLRKLARPLPGVAPGGNRRAKPNILLVEDHTPTAEMVQILLEDEGFTVTWAKTTEAALDFLSALPYLPSPFDLILLDLTVPVMSPLEMLKRLTDVSLPPIILVSAQPEHITAEAARSIGAAGFVLKPFHVEDLLERMREVLKLPGAPP